MKHYDEIIDQIWEENPGVFSSRKEVHEIVRTYIIRFKNKTKKFVDFPLPGIGHCIATGKGQSKLREKAYQKRLRYNVHLKNSMKKMRGKWTRKYIDDAFVKFI